MEVAFVVSAIDGKLVNISNNGNDNDDDSSSRNNKNRHNIGIDNANNNSNDDDDDDDDKTHKHNTEAENCVRKHQFNYVIYLVCCALCERIFCSGKCHKRICLVCYVNWNCL